MKKKFALPTAESEQKVISVNRIDCPPELVPADDGGRKERAAYILVNGMPELPVRADGRRYRLLAGGAGFFAAKEAGRTDVPVRVYRFSEEEAEVFSAVERLKTDSVGAMEGAYLMKRLISDYGWTQEDIARRIGKSRPAVANTLRLLTLVPEVVGLVESGKLSAGHARALVSVPAEKQYAFAEEVVRRGYSVRETERAVKSFLTPPEVLRAEKAAALAAKSEELKAFVERMRAALHMKVSLIGNDKKGRIYIDYFSAEELYRFMHVLDVIESEDFD